MWIDSGGATWVYDFETGILLHSSTATQGAAIQGPLAQGDSRQGATLIAQNTLVNVRTGVTASVGRIGPVAQGRRGVVITESGAGEVIDYLYDAGSGMLLAVHTFDRVLNAETQLRLVAAR